MGNGDSTELTLTPGPVRKVSTTTPLKERSRNVLEESPIFTENTEEAIRLKDFSFPDDSIDPFSGHDGKHNRSTSKQKVYFDYYDTHGQFVEVDQAQKESKNVFSSEESQYNEILDRFKRYRLGSSGEKTKESKQSEVQKLMNSFADCDQKVISENSKKSLFSDTRQSRLFSVMSISTRSSDSLPATKKEYQKRSSLSLAEKSELLITRVLMCNKHRNSDSHVEKRAKSSQIKKTSDPFTCAIKEKPPKATLINATEEIRKNSVGYFEHFIEFTRKNRLNPRDTFVDYQGTECVSKQKNNAEVGDPPISEDSQKTLREPFISEILPHSLKEIQPLVDSNELFCAPEEEIQSDGSEATVKGTISEAGNLEMPTMVEFLEH